MGFGIKNSRGAAGAFGRSAVRVAAVLLVLTLAIPAMTGCGGKTDQDPGASGDNGTAGTTEQPAENGGMSPEEEQRQADLKAAEAAGFLILANKTHPLEENYKPEDLASVKYYAEDRSPEGRYLRAEAADKFHLLVETAQAEAGLVFKMTTAYRSYGFQKILYDNYVKKDGEEAANRYSAKPGQSEHQTGLAADVSSPSVDYRLTVDYENTEEGQWLAENAHRFGFIIRYPKDKVDVTGYQYEPWHIRYVGETAAGEIYEKGIALEEFLDDLAIESDDLAVEP